MDIAITARGLDITDRFRRYVEEKGEKIAALAPKAIACEVKMSRHSLPKGGDDRAELMLIGPGPLVRAEATAGDKYAAFDLAYGKLLERIRAGKDRQKVHRGRHRPVSLGEASADAFAATDLTPASAEMLRAVATGSIPVIGEDGPDLGESPVVIRRKVFPATTMTAEDAVDHMELVGHDFFLFVDAETDRPSVVYRRKGWAYGVIALEAEAVPRLVEPRRGRKRA